MTTITVNSAGIILTAASYTNPVSIVAGVSVIGEYSGIYGTGEAWTIENSGTVQGIQGEEGTTAYGIELQDGGNITNTATGTISATASYSAGIYIAGGTATVLNQGSIISNGYGVLLKGGGIVGNAAGARIEGGRNGIDLSGGTGSIVNDGSIVSTGQTGIYLTTTTGSITNAASGMIQGVAGVYFGSAGGELSNAGTIQGSSLGVEVAADHVSLVNDGVITVASTDARQTPAYTAIRVDGAGSYLTIDNMEAGTISCATGDGISLAYGAAGVSITNAGLITASGSGILIGNDYNETIGNQAGAVIEASYGITVAGGAGDIVNNAGLIQGFDGVVMGAADSTITNSGTIIAVGEGDAQYGIKCVGTATGLVIDNVAGGAISAAYGTGIGIGASGATITNDGLITAYTAAIGVHGSLGEVGIVNDAGGTIQGAVGIYMGAEASSITNAGAIAGAFGIMVGPNAESDTIINQAGGLITGISGGIASGAYTLPAPDLVVLNAAGGTISGQVGILALGDDTTVTNDGAVNATGSAPSPFYDAIYVGGANDTITNAGTLTAPNGSAVVLASGGILATIVNQASGVMSGYQGIYADGAQDSITNAGLIESTGTARFIDGIRIGSMATSAMITNDAGATITGSHGVYIAAAYGTLVNDGMIDTPADGHYAVTSGTLAAQLLVSNAAGATMSGAGGVALYGTGDTLVNDGTILSTGTFNVSGVYTRYGAAYAVVDNHAGGVIMSAQDGLYLGASDGTIVNQGVIEGGPGSAGTYVGGIITGEYATGLQITNEAGATITGGSGIYLYAAQATITNDGQILAGNAAYDQGIGVGTYATGAVINNDAGGTISGINGVYLLGAGSTLTNAGVIEAVAGGRYGVTSGTAATQLQISNAAGGLIAGVAGVGLYGTADTLVNQGSILSTGTVNVSGVYANDAAADVAIENRAGGVISATENGIYVGAGSSTIVNQGAIEGGAGSAGTYVAGIYAGSYAVGLQIMNEAGATIAGETGIYLGGGYSTLVNDGQIIGGSGAYNQGVAVGSYASDVAVDNAQGGTISGLTGIAVYGSNDTITNAGQITGNQQRGIAEGGGGNFASLGRAPVPPSLTIDNQAGGTISGHGTGIYAYAANISNEAGALIEGGAGGVYVYGAAFLNNDGTIDGGSVASGVSLDQGGTIDNGTAGAITGADGIDVGYGAVTLHNAGSILGTAGHGIYAYGAYASTIVNAAGASIIGQTGVYLGGTLTNAGTIAGAGGTAVAFAGGASNLLVIDPGAVFTGQVDGGGSGSAIELAAGGPGTFDGLGVSFTNFTSVTVDAGAGWYITGSADTLGVGSTLTVDGLADLYSANLQDGGAVVNASLLILQGSTLAADSLTGAGVTRLLDGSTLSVQGAVGAGQFVEFGTPGGGALLVLGTGADMAGTIASFGAMDIIDVADLAFSAGSTATVSGNVMTVTDGSVTDMFATSGLADGTFITSLSDGNGGTDLIFGGAPPPPPAALALASGSDSGVAGDDITNDTTPVITGTGVANDIVTLYDGSTVVGTGTVLSDGTWSIVTSTLSAGAQILTATQSLGGGPASSPSTALTLTIDTAIPAPPAALTLAPDSDSGVAGDDITNDVTPTITGTGVANDTIVLYDGETVVGTGTVLSDGTWSIVTGTLAAGTQVLTATQTDVAGNVSTASSPLTLTIDTASPAPPAALTLAPGSDSGVAGDDITNDVTPTITGTGVANDTIILYDGETVIGTGTVLGDGTWSIATSTLSAGLQILTATETDVAGNVSAASNGLSLTIDTANPAPPASLTLAAGSDSGVKGDNITDDVTPTITGSGTANDIITLYDGATVVGTGTVLSDGTWSVATSTLSAGTQTLRATQTDAAGNVSGTSNGLTLTIDTANPAPPAALTLAPGSDSGVAGDDITNDVTPTITGTGVANDTIFLYDGETVVGTGTVLGNGTWSIVTGTLSLGTQILTATQTDAAGNVSAASNGLTLTIDITPPAPPAALTLAPGSDSGVAGDDITNDVTPTITGTGVANDTIILYDGETVVGTGTVLGDGTWSIVTGTLSAGLQTLTATLTDAAGNVSTASTALALTIDTTPPAPPAALTLAPGSDSGVVGDDITDDVTPTITGTGIANDTIVLYDGETVVGTGTVLSDGTWSIATSTLSAGTQILTATQTDAAGNVSAASSALTLTIEAANPAPPAALTLAPDSDTGTPGDDITEATTPTITGTGVANDTITLYDGATIVGTATVLGDGTWSVVTAALAIGVNDLTATQTDAAGDVSAASAALALTIVPAPDAPTLSDPSADSQPGEPVLAGAAPDNSVVSLYLDGVLTGTATASSTGGWSFAFPGVLAAGTYSVTATATDSAGDVSVLSAPLTLQVSDTGGYVIVLPPDQAGDVVSRIHDDTGLLVEVDTRNAAQQLLQSVSNTQAILEIYDSRGVLIGTIAQPSMSAASQPVFATQGQTLSATTGSGPVGSLVTLLSESNVITSQGNDTVIAGPGADTIYAAGASCSVIGGSGTLLYIGGACSTTVLGGSGQFTVYGGLNGGLIEGGAAGHNVLVAGGGATTVTGGGAGDVLVGGAGQATLAMEAGGVAFGGTGNNTLFGAAGGVLVAGSGTNVLIAGDGPEALWGGTGTATLFGGTGSDTLASGIGNDTLIAGDGSTVFVDGGGHSTLWGGAGQTTVFGSSGTTQVNLGSGLSQVLFGDGTMSVNGGTGTDLYDVTHGASSGGSGVIDGFKVGTDEVRLFGYSAQDAQESVQGGNLVVSLNDGTTLTFVGVTALAPQSLLFG